MEMMKSMPLRYNISSLRQLTGCKSNNSRDLSIHVTEFYNNYQIQGLRISVDHIVLGTLFACVVHARGELVTTYTEPIQFHEFTYKEILKEIEKYGFYVTFNPRESLPGSQIDYLMTLDKLHFDKLRVIDVWDDPIGVKESQWYIVAFKSAKHKYWLNNDYSPSKKEFTDALLAGSALNLSDICQSKHYRWDWLDYVANISDIILDNAGDEYSGQTYKETEGNPYGTYQYESFFKD